ncbi:hypothetical protein CDO28_22040 (plasmid) [Sinorhizobium meliloti]|uniref:DUF1254 domain-containing protein n=2 Tax=Rhizobium meliloti TaxID=382 RepID=UPI000B4A4EE7|nr:DUF1254 domain-containing protein [Sinorhizobium meliloti]ASP74820.1 hypothetical protein CDO28_22040 [Sinorhizobium meliloti]MDE3857316.1 DUF1254 domain-containing protein [Sinorhizobium meliloti]MQW51686.1 DUF1254 domain-containing protein [Sinorhizobium meliloti]
MKIARKYGPIAAAFVAALAVTTSYAQSPTPGYNTKIPEQILTPDKVESSIGTLNFADGVPTAETAGKVYDYLDTLRGVEVFLNFMPAASLEALRMGNAEMGATKPNQALIFDQLLDSNPLLLTGNTDTVYCSVFLDLETDGPTVVEVPPGTGPGTVNDAFFRFVIDMGAPGPDQGKGGKYLIVPADYKGDLPKDKSEDGDYYVARSPSHVNWLILRGFLVDGKPDAASKLFREGLKVYPLAKKSNPPKMEFLDGSKVAFNTVHANTFEFYKELDHVIQKEPIDLFDPELRGLAAGIGIRKGRSFAPDDRMTKILTDAVGIGNATARSIAFHNRDPRSPLYPNSQWRSGFVGSDYRWIDLDGVSGRNKDARTNFFYMATVNTPAMAAKLIGKGSQYALITAEATGNAFDGAKTYRLNVPSNPPAKDFWSVVLYDPQTRSELQTSQPFPSRNSKRDKLVANADGSVDLYFGPKAPAGKDSNWIETIPGKGWFSLLRLYGPLEPWFDKTWRPGEIEEVR